jgi:hypothetical protein
VLARISIARVPPAAETTLRMTAADSPTSMACFAFCRAVVAFYQVIEPPTGPKQQDAKPLVTMIDDPLPVRAAKSTRRRTSGNSGR